MGAPSYALGNFAQSDASRDGRGALYEGGMAWLQVGYTYEGEMDVCALAVYQVPDTDVTLGSDSIDDFTFCTRFTLYQTTSNSFLGYTSTGDQAAYKQSLIASGDLTVLATYTFTGPGWAVMALPENTVLKYIGLECTELNPGKPTADRVDIAEVEPYRTSPIAPSAPPLRPPNRHRHRRRRRRRRRRERCTWSVPLRAAAPAVSSSVLVRAFQSGLFLQAHLCVHQEVARASRTPMWRVGQKGAAETRQPLSRHASTTNCSNGLLKTVAGVECAAYHDDNDASATARWVPPSTTPAHGHQQLEGVCV